MNRLLRIYPCILVAFLSSITLHCGFRTSIPKVDYDPESVKVITSWRIIGPFRLPDNEQSYTLENEKRALNRNHLAEIGGSEAPFKIGNPTTRFEIDFERDASALPASSDKNSPFTFLNQVVDFPVPQVSSHMIFSSNSDFFKIMYAVANIVAEKNIEMNLIVSGNSPLKIWVNNSVVADPPSGSVGNAQQIQHLARVRLKPGNNYLVAKMFCFPLLNEFCVRLAGEKGARAFIQEKAGIRDLLESVVSEPGKPLRLTKNLLFFNDSTSSESRYEILGSAGNEVVQSGSVALNALEIPIQGLSNGLYTLLYHAYGRTYSQLFYIGLPAEIYPTYKTRCNSFAGNKDQLGDPCLSVAGLQEIHKEVQTKGFRQDWQKKAIVYASMIENGLNPVQPGFRMHAYYSKVDGQYQYYLFYKPRNSSRNLPPPLVIEVPHNAYGTIVSQDPEALVTGESQQDPYFKLKTQCLVSRDANYLLRLALFCDEYGYACLFPFTRFRQFEDPLAVTDMLQVIEESKKVYPVDSGRIYLRGFCRGGGNAIKMAEHYPDLFAAVSAINLNVNPDPFPLSNQTWSEGSDIRRLADNLTHIPIQLVHGRLFPHSPISQSQEFSSICRKQNIPVQLELFEGDSQWDDKDEYRVSFEFFRNKKRVVKPHSITYVTGQLKYSSAYWIHINRLLKPAVLGRIHAKWETPNRIILSTENVGEVEINRENLPQSGAASPGLNVVINGQTAGVGNTNNGNPVFQLQPMHQLVPFQKNRLIEGPIAHALSEPFILVQGTGGLRESKPKIQATIENIQTYWEGKHFVQIRRKFDHEVTPADIMDMNLVLIGNLGAKTPLKPIIEKIPIVFHKESIRIGDHNYIGNNALAVLVYPNPGNPNRYIVIVNANNYRAFHLPEPDLARYRSDLVIWEQFINGKSKLAGQWIWDASWQHLIAAPTTSKK